MTPDQQFRKFLKQHGIAPPKDLIADGDIHRLATIGAERKKDASYILRLDPVPSGGCQNWKTAEGWVQWDVVHDREFTAAELAEAEAQAKADRLKQESERDKRHAEASVHACKIWGEATECPEHPYLTKKGVNPNGVRLVTAGYFRGCIAVPVMDTNGEPQSLQFISPDGEKRFLSGGRMQGGSWTIGSIGQTICIAEGFATGASIYEATGHAVVVAFNCGNLLSVGKALRAKHPGASLVVCGDDDAWTPGNPGRAAATEVAEQIGGRAVFPNFGPERVKGQTDFNDLHRAQGLESVKVLIDSRKRLVQVSWTALRGQPVLPVQYDIQGLFPRVSFGIIAGQPGHGKSILVIQAAVAKATGLPLLGFDSGAPGGTVIVVLEDDKSVVHRRLQAVVDTYGKAFSEEHHHLLDVNLKILLRPSGDLTDLSPDQLNLVLSGLTGEITESMKACEAPPAMVLIDTLNSVHDGDENSSKETRPLVAAALGLSARLMCSVWLVHHLIKVRGIKQPLVDRLDPELIRGSSAIHGAIRGAIQFGWILPNEAKKVGLDPERCNRRYAVLAGTKQNDGVPGPWVLIQHSKNAGLWERSPNGEAILAGILATDTRGRPGASGLSPAEAVLKAIYNNSKLDGKLDRAELAARVWPDGKDAKGSLRKVIQNLRKIKLVHPDKDELTAEGRKVVMGKLAKEEGGPP